MDEERAHVAGGFDPDRPSADSGSQMKSEDGSTSSGTVSSKKKLPLPPLAYSVSETMALIKSGRTFVYSEISEGNLEAIKLGRKTLITHTSLMTYVATRPRLGPKRQPLPLPIAGSDRENAGPATTPAALHHLSSKTRKT